MKTTLKRNLLPTLILVSLSALLCGCANAVTFAQAGSIEPVGFWYGLWHGMIAPIAWIVSLFDHSVAIYAIYNNGGWYNFGFILGIGGLSGGASKAS